MPLFRIEKESIPKGDSDTCNCAFCFRLKVVYPALPRNPFVFDERYSLFVSIVILILHGLHVVYIHIYVPTTL